MCWPLQHFSINCGELAPIDLTMVKSCTTGLPAAPPPRVFATLLVMPHEKLRSSISPLCLCAVESPSMPSIFRNISTAIVCSSSTRECDGQLAHIVRGVIAGDRARQAAADLSCKPSGAADDRQRALTGCGGRAKRVQR